MKKLTILIDVDSIVADLTSDWFGAYNKDYDDNMTMDRVTGWNTHEFVKPECGTKIYKYLTPELISNLKPIRGSVECVKTLQELGHTILFVTAVYNANENASARVQWLMDHFPFVDPKNIIISHHKELIKGDVIIDDKPATLLKYHENWPSAALYSIKYPYNEHLEDIAFLRGCWRDPEIGWALIMGDISLHALALHDEEVKEEWWEDFRSA